MCIQRRWRGSDQCSPSDVPKVPSQGTDRSMLDFNLDAVYPALSSDEGPPFGEAGISTEGWPEVRRTLKAALVRSN